MRKSSHKISGNQLFERYNGNPILTARDWPYPANAVINPGAAVVNNETVLLVRVVDSSRSSHLTVARSSNGLSNWHIDTEPTLMPNESSRGEKFGLEDPRVVFLEEQKQFAVIYVSASESGPMVAMAITKNFRKFARLGSLLPPEDGDASLFPRRFNGRFALIHRPIVGGTADIWISYSPDLKHWGDHRPLIITRPNSWDSHRVGLACQPIESREGWLLFYHGMSNTPEGAIYRVGIALLDLQSPWRVLRRSEDWLLEPCELYERVGDIGGVVFPTGATVDKKSNKINLYYGTADRSVAVATANFDDIVDYVASCAETE